MNKVLRISLFSVAALLPLRAQAEVLCALGTTSAPYESMVDMPPSAAAQAEMKKLETLLCPKGCGKVFLFANATTPNTATVTDGTGTSKVTYSPSFATSVQKNFGPIATLGIFAHDLGHHLDATGNRLPWMKDSWDGELRADAWAGCAIAKSKLTPSRLQAVLLAMSTYPSTRQPDWSVRRPVITEGYNQCGGKVLPPLAKENAEQAGKGGRKDDAGTLALGGCAGDRDCRNRRVCINSRCVAAPERRHCGKDTDCPEPQECGGAGVCVDPSSQTNQARVQEETPEAPKPPGPMLAALEEKEKRPAAPPAEASGPPPSDVAACRRSCDEVRNQCIEAITSETNKCLSAIRSEAGYRQCSCPNYPAGNTGCYNFCANAYEKGKSCAADALVHDCKTDGDRCRAQCK